MIGLPVLVGSKLKRIGRVQEVLLTRDGSRVCGLELESGGWFHAQRILDYKAVTTIRETHVLAEEVYLTAGVPTHCCRDLQGLPVLDPRGEELGLMDDFHFVPADGRVTLLQLSRGFVDDLLYGKEIVPLQASVRAGEAAILLNEPGDLSGGALP